MSLRITSGSLRKRLLCVALIMAAAGLFLSACSEGGQVETAPPVTLISNLEGTHAVDDSFREFYEQLGGERILGPAISPVQQTADGSLIQYTHAALMVYNPDAPAVERFYLAPLGLELGVVEPPVPPTTPERGAYVEGHYIFPDFQPLFDRLGGVRVVGRPLGEVHFNLQKNRYEQYFENVGFYRMEGQTAEGTALLAYGAYRCDRTCRSQPPQNAIIEAHPEVAAPFSDMVNRLGMELTGYSLTEAYSTEDGKIEQVFENVILVADANNLQNVSIRPLNERLGILSDPPRAPSSDPSTFFYEVGNGVGYSVPRVFWEFIEAHGGFAVSGPPVTDMDHSRGLFHQCFTNLCLEYSTQQTVRPVALGYQYRGFYARPQVVAEQPPQSEATNQPPASGQGGGAGPEAPANEPQPPAATTAPAAVEPAVNPEVSGDIILQVWTKSQAVAADVPQEVGVRIYANKQPLAGAVPVVRVTLPDGSEWSGSFPPSGPDGSTVLQIPPINALNGTLIPYQVCLDLENGVSECFQDSFMVWGTP